MKNKCLTVIALTGLVLASCGSGQNKDNTQQDSLMTDTVAMDTSVTDKTLVDTVKAAAGSAVDTTSLRKDNLNSNNSVNNP